MKMHGVAVWEPCPGVVNDGRDYHHLRDGCLNCAPFWEAIPLCPNEHEDGRRRKLTSNGYCKKCRQHFDMDYDHEALMATVATKPIILRRI
jgi:hypothetical protein